MERPNAANYNLSDVTERADYVMAWNEYSNLLKLEIERLKEENLKLRKDENY